MDIRDYVGEGEEILAEVRIHDDPYALFFSGTDGLLACTEQRIVYISGKEVRDVSINRVDSFKYHAPSMPKPYLYSGIGALLLAIIGRGGYPGLSTFAFIIGPVLIATAYWLRTSSLTIYTPSESFVFQSREDDLVDIAHMLRDREN